MTPPLRKVIHVDMDAFYASVEQRDRPELRGRPVIVGGAPDGRGVVAAASYEARRYGVRSALPSARAYRLCPEAVFLPPDFARYRAESQRIQAIFHRVTDLVEPLSLDEAYLDVTENELGQPSATRIAEGIRAEVRDETGLTASAGVAPNKFLAKVASDMDKPDGLVVIPPERVAAALEALPIARVPGVGPITAQRLRDLGLHTCGDVRRTDEARLRSWLGRGGVVLRDLARGLDPRPVVAEHVRKSVSVEDTLGRDVRTRAEALEVLDDLCGRLEGRLSKAGVHGRTVTLKVKYADFQVATRSRTLHHPAGERPVLLAAARELLAETEAGRRPVRLLGVGVSHLHEGGRQLLLPFYEEMLRGEARAPSPRC